MGDNTATVKENVPVHPSGYMRSDHYFDKVMPVTVILADLAARENCAGEIYNAAQAAVEYIHFLEQERLEYVRELSRLHETREADFRKDMPAWTTIETDDGDKALLTALSEITYDPQQNNTVRMTARLALAYIHHLNHRTFDYLEGQLHHYLARWYEEYTKRIEAQQATKDTLEGLARDEGARVAEKLLNYSRAYGQMRRRIETLKNEVRSQNMRLQERNKTIAALEARLADPKATTSENG